ncbi:MAG: beta-galactosidase [Armatimonadota bacterium]|nr:beta-galactosidase [Armatimonadota bacterium]
MTRTRSAITIAATLLLAAPLAAQQEWHVPELVEADHVYSMDFVTPHVQWLKPLPGGPAKVLFFVRAKGTPAREIAEVAQRAAIEPEIVYFDRTGNEVAGGEPGMDRALRLIREGPDAYVLGNVSFDALSGQAQYYLLEEVVKRGAGLVAFGAMPEIAFTDERALAEPPPELLTGLPLASLPKGREIASGLNLSAPTDAELIDAMVTRYRLGEGRALGINYRAGTLALTPRLDFSYEALQEYEYWAAFAAKTIVWAAGRDAGVSLADWPDRPLAMHRRDLPAEVTVSAMSGLPEGRGLSVAVAVRRDDGRRIDLGRYTAETARGEVASVSVELPALPAGTHHLEVRVSTSRGQETFGVLPLDVTSARGIEGVTLAADFAEVGEIIEGTVAMRGQAFTADERLEVRLRDGEGRVVAARMMEPAAGELPFSFEVPRFRTILMRAEAALIDSRGEVDREHATFTVPDRNRGQFNFVMWNFPHGVLGYWGLRSLRDNGVTTILSGGGEPSPEIAAADLPYVPYTTRILEEIGEDGVMQPVCWNNEPEVTEHIQEIADKYVGARRHGVYVYSLGDENNTWGACAHPECLEAYRQWLRGQYESIEALNDSWGSDFGTFDDIELFEPGDINEQAALNAGHVARWYDRQAFKRYNYAQYCGRYAEMYRTLDPLAITGFEGAGRFGDDYHEIIQRVGFWGPYPGIGDDLIRSLAPRELITSNWMGYRREAPPMVQRMWRMISNGYHGVWWWRWDNIGRFHGFLAPDLHPWDDTSQVVIDEMRDLVDGVGTMMLRMDMPHDGIGLLYSMPSAFADERSPHHRTSPIVLAHNAFLEATQDLGYQAHYLCDDTVRDGDLTDGDERALILPMGRAVPDDVAAEIRRFVDGGGLVIADLRPGVRDGHCKRREAGVLDDVFGIRQRPLAQDRPELEERTVSLDAALGGRHVELPLQTLVDPALELDGGEALADSDGVPLLVVNRFGEGTAVLLNFAINSYLELREEMAELPVRELLGAIYMLHEIEPPFEQSGDGGPLRWTETVRWEAPGVTIIGLFRTAGENGPATTVLPQARYVYDLRRDRSLGETRRISAPLRVGFANLYAVTERPIGEVVISLQDDTVAPGESVEGVVRTRGRGQALLPVRVRVFRPDGSEESWPHRVLMAEDGTAPLSIPMALNAQPGTWRIAAREVLSGQAAEVEVTVAAK